MSKMNNQAPENQWDQIGLAFVREYYNTYDTNPKKEDLANYYHGQALLTFEDRQSQGTAAIKEAFGKVTFSRIQHIPTKIDCQPTSENGILIQVTGRLKTDDDPPHAFSQTFYLKPSDGNYFIFHDIFRLSIHNG